MYRHTRTVGAMADKSVNAKQGTAKSDAVLVADALLRASNRLAIAKKLYRELSACPNPLYRDCVRRISN